MYRYPTLAEASPSFTFLARLLGNPARWSNDEGANHVWAAWGYFQGEFVGSAEAQSVATEEELKGYSSETIEHGFEALAAKGRGEAVGMAIGQGLLKALVGRLIKQMLESGLAEDLIRKLIGDLLKPSLPG